MKTSARIGIVLFLIFLTSIITKAQAPGYLGKTVYFKVSDGLILSPSKDRPYTTLTQGFSDNSGPSIGHTFTGEIGYTYSRKNVVALIFGGFQSAVQADYYFDLMDNYTDSESLVHFLDAKIIGLKHYSFLTKKGALAPYGTSYSFGLEGHFIKGRIDPDEDDQLIDLFSTNTRDFLENPKFNFLNLSFSWLKHNIYRDRIIFSYGFTARFPLALRAADAIADRYRLEPDFSFSSDPEEFNVEVFELFVLNRLIRRNAIHFNLGVGLLLF